MNKKSLLVGGSIFGAILASTCCVLPFVLFSLGISGAWMSNLRSFEPYSLFFILLSIIFTLSGFIVMKKKQENKTCSENGYCSSNKADQVRKIVLWCSLGLILVVLMWPVLLPFLLGNV